MRALIQRVKHASVSIDGTVSGRIDTGLLLFLGVQKGDDEAAADKLLRKCLAYRVFADAEGEMNLNLQQVEGGLLVISQFTLAADTGKGLRPSFSSAMPPAEGERLYHYFLTQARLRHADVAAGQFGADMQVALINDGPVTFILDS